MSKLAWKYNERKKNLVKLLKEKNLYEPSDNELIMELIRWMKIGDMAMQDIDTHGITINVVRDPDKPPLYQTNQSISILKESSTKMAMLYTKLSISPQERSKLKVEEPEDNSFDEDFN